MRSGKRMLAGVAAAALGAALVPAGIVAVAAPASAATYTVSAEFPSMTILSNVDDSIQIGLSTALNGEDTSIAGTAVGVYITNSSGAGWLNNRLGNSDDTYFHVADDSFTSNELSTGTGNIDLGVGAGVGTGTFATIPTGTYTMTLQWYDTASGVSFAQTSMPITMVNSINAGTVTGSGRYLSTAAWATATTVSSATVATDDSIATYNVAFLNGSGGPIVAKAAAYSATATPDRAGNAATMTPSVTANGTEPGIITLTRAGSGDAGTWSSSAGAGAIEAAFANPVNQITAALPVTITGAATLTSATLTSEISSSSLTGTILGSPTKQLAIPAVNGVKFTVAGVTQVSGTAAAGVPVSIAVAPASGVNVTTGSPVSYSSISPATTQNIVSGTGGAFSQEYTVSNPVNGQGVRVTATVPGTSGTTSFTYFVQFQTPGMASGTLTAVPSAITTANSGEVTVNAAVADQFGTGLANWPVQVTVTGVAAATATTVVTDSTGVASYKITVPTGTVSGAVSSVNWVAWTGTTFTGGKTATTTVTYTSQSAAVASLTATGAFSGAATLYSTLTDGTLNASTNPLYVNTQWGTSAYTPAYDGYSWKIQVVAKNSSGTVIAGAPVTISGADGAKVQNSAGTWSDSVTAYSSSTGVVTAVLTSEKTGTKEWTIKSGDVTTTVKAVYTNRPTDARYVEISSSSTKVTAGSGATITAKVTDRYGNTVAGVPIAFSETGPGYIAGTGTATTNSSGVAEATYVTVGGQEGKSEIGILAGNGTTASVVMPSALPSAAAQVPATAATLTLQVGNAKDTVTSYAIPTGGTTPSSATIAGVTAGVSSASLEIEVTTSPTDKSIVIVGERGTVKGKPGIMVDGNTVGFDAGAKMVPHIKFPGQTAYSEGSARPTVDDMGEFYWQRKTGKKIYIYFSNEDGDVKSDRIIIQAK